MQAFLQPLELLQGPRSWGFLSPEAAQESPPLESLPRSGFRLPELLRPRLLYELLSAFDRPSADFRSGS